MNSMFSSFDVFAAEFFGQKVKASFVSTANNKANNNTNLQSQLGSTDSTKVANKKSSSRNKKQEGHSTSSSSSSKVKGHMKPRFAPELDGLNCFETLVSY